MCSSAGPIFLMLHKIKFILLDMKNLRFNVQKNTENYAWLSPISYESSTGKYQLPSHWVISLTVN